jgi:anti-anti-sigma factor
MRENDVLNLYVEKIGRVIILHVNGTLYLETIAMLESVWNEQVAQCLEVIAIDCVELSQVDSTAIATLVKFFNIAMSRNIHIIFYDLNKAIMSLFQTAKLNMFFSVTTKQNFESSFLQRTT